MARPTVYLLDTNIILHLIRGSALGRHIQAKYGLGTILAEGLISIVTVAEVMAFARKRAWGKNRLARMQNLLDSFDQIDINYPELIEGYADIDAASYRLHHVMGKNDLWIAATAHMLQIPLLTMDKDFDHLNGQWLTVVWVDPAHGKTP